LFLACRDAVLMRAGFESVFQGLEELEVRSLEMLINRDLSTQLGFNLSARKERSALAGELEERGVSLCAVLLQNDFMREDVVGEVDYVVRACEAAADLGVAVARINALMRKAPGFTLDRYVERAASSVEECLKRVGKLGVSLAVENHGLICNDREFLRRLLGEVGPEHFGLTLDTGNFYWFGYPLREVYEIVDEFAGAVRHTHVKNAVAEAKHARREPRQVVMAPMKEGDLDLKRITEALRKAGYDRDLTIEDESLGRFPPEERKRVLKEDAQHLRSLLG